MAEENSSQSSDLENNNDEELEEDIEEFLD